MRTPAHAHIDVADVARAAAQPFAVPESAMWGPLTRDLRGQAWMMKPGHHRDAATGAVDRLDAAATALPATGNGTVRHAVDLYAAAEVAVWQLDRQLRSGTSVPPAQRKLEQLSEHLAGRAPAAAATVALYRWAGQQRPPVSVSTEAAYEGVSLVTVINLVGYQHLFVRLTGASHPKLPHRVLSVLPRVWLAVPTADPTGYWAHTRCSWSADPGCAADLALCAATFADIDDDGTDPQRLLDDAVAAVTATRTR